MTKRTILTAGAVGLIAVSQAGCLLVAAAAGTGATVAYVRGDTEGTVDATPDKVAAASKAALEEMNLTVISHRGSALDGDVVARTAGDAKVHVVVKGQGERSSHVSIRIGTFGDQAMSNRILLKINEKLARGGATTQPAVAARPATQPVAASE